MKLDRKTLALIAIVVVLASLGAATQLTIISSSKVEIQPEGYVDEDGNVRGSFWVTTLTTDCTDKVAAWTFHNESDRDKYYEGEAVAVESEIEVVIDPEPPYWIRPLEVHSHQVYPKTYGTVRDVLNRVSKRTDVSIPSLSVNTYQFGARADVPNVWAVHTPFWITLKKNGVELSKQFFDTVGKVETIRLENPNNSEEYLLLKNLGKLGTGYGQPSISDIICVGEQIDYCFSGSDEVENKINYDACDMAYSNYWFGGGQHYTEDGRVVRRWPDGSPAHYTIWAAQGTPVADGAFPGSTTDIGPFNAYVTPIAADVWQDKPTTNPYGKSLVHYLKDYHRTLDVDVWKCGVEITDDNFLKVNLPYSSVNSIVTVQMSTELADTVVYKPQVANVKFVSCQWESGETATDIADRVKATMTVRQESTVKSTATITPVLGTTGQPVTINPAAHTVDLSPGATTSIEFEFLNLGTTEDLSNTVDFVIKNTLGAETDKRTLTFTLKKKGVAETILTVNTVDAETKQPLGGIPITITYDSSTDTDYTIGGTVVFDLEGVEAKVTVKSSETADYQAASTTTNVKAGQPNEVTLHLWKKGVTPITIPWWLLAVAACGVVIVWYSYKKRKG